MLKSKFESYLNFLENKTVVITSHALADLDGLASAIALYFFLQSQPANISLHLYFSKISKKARLYIEKLEAKFPNFIPVFKDDITNLGFDVAFIVDTNKLSKVEGEFSDDIQSFEDNYIIFIDHHYAEHSDTKEEKKRDAIILENYTSTSEIVVDLYKEFQIPLKKPIRYLLIGGLVIDSGYLKFANKHTHKAMAFLLEDDIQYQDILSMLKVEPHISEKIAKIKGAQRVELLREDDWLIGVSHVSSFEASVANTLLKIGFDISIVISERKDECRVSLRAKQKVCEQSGLHLGKMLEKLSKDLDAVGGGHDGAASIKMNKKEPNIKNIILEKVKEALSNIDK
jgi:nanoRNase/pAp phosphatase (c-di-AMP/oligoRNAs hydrolase)